MWIRGAFGELINSNSICKIYGMSGIGVFATLNYTIEGDPAPEEIKLCHSYRLNVNDITNEIYKYFCRQDEVCDLKEVLRKLRD